MVVGVCKQVCCFGEGHWDIGLSSALSQAQTLPLNVLRKMPVGSPGQGLSLYLLLLNLYSLAETCE